MSPQDLPSGAGKVATQYPEVWEAFSRLGKACSESGPLDARTRRLVKLALSVVAGSLTPSRAPREGVEPEALKQVAMLAIPTIGLPAGVAALTWIEDITDKE